MRTVIASMLRSRVAGVQRADRPTVPDHVLAALVRAAVEPAVEPRRPRAPPRRSAAATRSPTASAASIDVVGPSPRTERRERAGRLVPVGPLEDAGLALEPAPVRLVDVLGARREDVEDEPAAGLEQPRAPRGARAASRSSSGMCSSERNGQITSGTRSSTGGSRRSPRRRSTRCATPSRLGERARDRSSIALRERRRRSRGRRPARSGRRSAPCRRRARRPGRRRCQRLVDVEGDVLGDRGAPRVVDRRDASRRAPRGVNRSRRAPRSPGAVVLATAVHAWYRSAAHGRRRTRARGPRGRRRRDVARTRSRRSGSSTWGARARSSSRCARCATARPGWR